MLFVEFRFFWFFLAVFAVYWSLRRNGSRKFWLLISSYFFYACWNWKFLFLIMASTALDYFVGPDGLSKIPPEFRDMLLANIEDWRAITTAPEALPGVTREQIASITVPVLLISGAETAPVHRLIDPELAHILPRAERVIIAGGTHDMCSEKPAECAAAINRFIGKQRH